MLRRNDTTSLLASLDGMQANLRGLVSKIKDSSASVALAAALDAEWVLVPKEQLEAVQQLLADMAAPPVTVVPVD